MSEAVDLEYIWLVILAMLGATYLTRVLPFVALGRYRNNARFRFVGYTLPPAVMFLLVVYCLKDVSFTTPPYGVKEILSVVAVAALHLWRKNALVSIACGTALYVFLSQRPFF